MSGSIKSLLAELLAEMKKLTGRIPDAEIGALKRSLAARRMGISLSKLNWRIKTGLTRTCEDRHLVPMSEIVRFTASQEEPTQEQEAPTALSLAHRRRGSVASDMERVRQMVREDNAKNRKKR